MAYSITELNQMNQDEFVAILGEVFEETPSIAAQAWQRRPFQNGSELHQSMVNIVMTMSLEKQDALICAHPDLGSKAKMADASVQEQAGVGLDLLLSEEYETLQRFNQQYKERFGFPFIIAVKNHTKASILEAFAERLQNSKDVERQQALTEIFRIAQFRLQGLILCWRIELTAPVLAKTLRPHTVCVLEIKR
ncbi:MAG: 2-oxo-4-hydroxy-4-carboxy-5-ureidoimidazoline decarboxylase [Thermosynechococcaceae cyanobacterium]